MITGNKGEWSEIYVFLRLLADGKIYAADDKLNKLQDIYFPIIKIIREEIKGVVKEYLINDTVKIYFNGTTVADVPAIEFENQASNLLTKIKSTKGKRAFKIKETKSFMNRISCFKLSAPSSNKADITMKIVDINTGYSPEVGFSIKSELGSAPTLLNAGKTTNFIFKIHHEHQDI